MLQLVTVTVFMLPCVAAIHLCTLAHTLCCGCLFDQIIAKLIELQTNCGSLLVYLIIAMWKRCIGVYSTKKKILNKLFNY